MKALRTLSLAAALLLSVSLLFAQESPEARMPGTTMLYVRVQKPASVLDLADPPSTPAGQMSELRKEWLGERAEELETTPQQLAAEIAGLGRLDVAIFNRAEGKDPGVIGITDLGASTVLRKLAEKETGFANAAIEVIEGTPVHAHTVKPDEGDEVRGSPYGFRLGDAFAMTNELDAARTVLKPDAGKALPATEGFKRASAAFDKDALLTVYCSIPQVLAAAGGKIEDRFPFFVPRETAAFIRELDTVTMEIAPGKVGPVMNFDAFLAKEHPSYDAIMTPGGKHDLLKLVSPDVKWCVSFHVDDGKARWARFSALMNKMTGGDFGQEVAMAEQQLQIKAPDEVANITDVVIGQVPTDDWRGMFVMLRAKDVGRVEKLMKKAMTDFNEGVIGETVIDGVTVIHPQGDQDAPTDMGGYAIFDDVFVMTDKMDTMRAILNVRKTKKNSLLDVPVNAKLRAALPEKPSKIIVFDPLLADDDFVTLLDAPRQRCFIATVEEPGRLRVHADIAPMIRALVRQSMEYGPPMRVVPLD